MSLELELNILLRGLIALALAAVLGWEREAAGKSAGLRTHMLIGLAASLFVSIAELLVQNFDGPPEQLNYDPTRVLEAVVTGVSFLGAGTIFISSRKDRVKGLTTAAEILVTAAVGMMVGLQAYVLASGVTAMTFLVVYALSFCKNGNAADQPER